MVNQETIYVKLLNEGADCWRPTIGLKVSEDCYEILATADYDPEDEEWEFLPGDLVLCSLRVLENTTVLVARTKHLTI